VDAHRRRRFTVLVAACCVALIPWIAFLVATLPRHYVASHWRLAWVGYDVALLIALVLCAYRAWRRRPTFPTTAVVTATLLTVDAWFDVVTASGRTDRLLSLAAALVELPLAALLAVAARRTRRLRDQGAPGWGPATPSGEGGRPSFGDGPVTESRDDHGTDDPR
jgi:hypothetical protein